MIDPKLNDWWSAKHRTDLSVVGTRFKGAGVSLRVLLRGLALKNLIWYSLVYGDFADNILMLALGKEIASSFNNDSYLHKGPMQEAFNGDGTFAEHPLNQEIQSMLGLIIDENSFRIERSEVIQKQIAIHDNCFFAIEPIDTIGTQKLIHCVLEQHSFYLGSEVHWDCILDETTALLNSVEELRLQSKPTKRQLILSWNDQASSSAKKIFGLRRSRRIAVHNGEPRYID